MTKTKKIKYITGNKKTILTKKYNSHVIHKEGKKYYRKYHFSNSNSNSSSKDSKDSKSNKKLFKKARRTKKYLKDNTLYALKQYGYYNKQNGGDVDDYVPEFLLRWWNIRKLKNIIKKLGKANVIMLSLIDSYEGKLTSFEKLANDKSKIVTELVLNMKKETIFDEINKIRESNINDPKVKHINLKTIKDDLRLVKNKIKGLNKVIKQIVKKLKKEEPAFLKFTEKFEKDSNKFVELTSDFEDNQKYYTKIKQYRDDYNTYSGKKTLTSKDQDKIEKYKAHKEEFDYILAFTDEKISTQHDSLKKIGILIDKSEHFKEQSDDGTDTGTGIDISKTQANIAKWNVSYKEVFKHMGDMIENAVSIVEKLTELQNFIEIIQSELLVIYGSNIQHDKINPIIKFRKDIEEQKEKVELIKFNIMELNGEFLNETYSVDINVDYNIIRVAIVQVENNLDKYHLMLLNDLKLYNDTKRMIPGGGGSRGGGSVNNNMIMSDSWDMDDNGSGITENMINDSVISKIHNEYSYMMKGGDLSQVFSLISWDNLIYNDPNSSYITTKMYLITQANYDLIIDEPSFNLYKGKVYFCYNIFLTLLYHHVVVTLNLRFADLINPEQPVPAVPPVAPTPAQLLSRLLSYYILLFKCIETIDKYHTDNPTISISNIFNRKIKIKLYQIFYNLNDIDDHNSFSEDYLDEIDGSAGGAGGAGIVGFNNAQGLLNYVNGIVPTFNGGINMNKKFQRFVYNVDTNVKSFYGENNNFANFNSEKPQNNIVVESFIDATVLPVIVGIPTVVAVPAAIPPVAGVKGTPDLQDITAADLTVNGIANYNYRQSFIDIYNEIKNVQSLKDDINIHTNYLKINLKPYITSAIDTIIQVKESHKSYYNSDLGDNADIIPNLGSFCMNMNLKIENSIQGAFRIVMFNVHQWQKVCMRNPLPGPNYIYNDPKHAIDFINDNLPNPDVVIFLEYTLYGHTRGANNRITQMQAADFNPAILDPADPTKYMINTSNEYANHYMLDSNNIGLDKYIITNDNYNSNNSFMGKAIYYKNNTVTNQKNEIISNTISMLNSTVKIHGVNVSLYIIYIDESLNENVQTVKRNINTAFANIATDPNQHKIIMGSFNFDPNVNSNPFTDIDKAKFISLNNNLIVKSGLKTNALVDLCYVSTQFNNDFIISNYETNIQTLVAQSEASDHHPIFLDIIKRNPNAGIVAPAGPLGAVGAVGVPGGPSTIVGNTLLGELISKLPANYINPDKYSNNINTIIDNINQILNTINLILPRQGGSLKNLTENLDEITRNLINLKFIEPKLLSDVKVKEYTKVTVKYDWLLGAVTKERDKSYTSKSTEKLSSMIKASSNPTEFASLKELKEVDVLLLISKLNTSIPVSGDPITQSILDKINNTNIMEFEKFIIKNINPQDSCKVLNNIITKYVSKGNQYISGLYQKLNCLNTLQAKAAAKQPQYGQPQYVQPQYVQPQFKPKIGP